MIRSASARLLRPAQVRFNWAPGNATPNAIPATRKIVDPAGREHLHGADNPTYLKKDGDKAIAFFGIFLTLATTGAVLNGVSNMKHNVGKLD